LFFVVFNAFSYIVDRDAGKGGFALLCIIFVATLSGITVYIGPNGRFKFLDLVETAGGLWPTGCFEKRRNEIL
jgi:hypothetical protein